MSSPYQPQQVGCLPTELSFSFNSIPTDPIHQYHFHPHSPMPLFYASLLQRWIYPAQPKVMPDARNLCRLLPLKLFYSFNVLSSPNILSHFLFYSPTPNTGRDPCLTRGHTDQKTTEEIEIKEKHKPNKDKVRNWHL